MIGKTNNKDLKNQIIFLKNLEKATKSSMPPNKFFYMISDKEKNSDLRKAFRQIAKDIENGQTLTDSIKKHPKLLDSTSTKVIRTGEQSGRLSEVIKSLITSKENYLSTRKKVTSALNSNAFNFIGSSAIFLLVIFGLIPGIAKFFEKFLPCIPAVIRIISGASQIVISVPTLIIVLVIVSVFIYLDYTDIKPDNPSQYIEQKLISLPIVGTIIKNTYLSIYFSTLKVCHLSGLSTYESTELADSTIEHPYLKQFTREVAKNSASGRKISELLFEQKIFEENIIQILEVGEETGRLEESYMDIQFYMQEQIEEKLSLIYKVIPIISKTLAILAVLLIFAVLGITMFSATDSVIKALG